LFHLWCIEFGLAMPVWTEALKFTVLHMGELRCVNLLAIWIEFLFIFHFHIFIYDIFLHENVGFIFLTYLHISILILGLSSHFMFIFNLNGHRCQCWPLNWWLFTIGKKVLKLLRPFDLHLRSHDGKTSLLQWSLVVTSFLIASVRFDPDSIHHEIVSILYWSLSFNHMTLLYHTLVDCTSSLYVHRIGNIIHLGLVVSFKQIHWYLLVQSAQNIPATFSLWFVVTQ